MVSQGRRGHLQTPSAKSSQSDLPALIKASPRRLAGAESAWDIALGECWAPPGTTRQTPAASTSCLDKSCSHDGRLLGAAATGEGPVPQHAASRQHLAWGEGAKVPGERLPHAVEPAGGRPRRVPSPERCATRATEATDTSRKGLRFRLCPCVSGALRKAPAAAACGGLGPRGSLSGGRPGHPSPGLVSGNAVRLLARPSEPGFRPPFPPGRARRPPAGGWKLPGLRGPETINIVV